MTDKFAFYGNDSLSSFHIYIFYLAGAMTGKAAKRQYSHGDVFSGNDRSFEDGFDEDGAPTAASRLVKVEIGEAATSSEDNNQLSENNVGPSGHVWENIGITHRVWGEVLSCAIFWQLSTVSGRHLGSVS